MRVKGSFCVLFLVLALFLLSSFTTARKEDPELRTCKHQCRVQRQYDERQKQKCEEQCEDYIKEKQGRETGKQRGDEDEDDDRTDKWAVNKDKSEKQSSKRQQGKSRGDEEEGDEERENPYVFNEDDFETLFQTEFGSDRVLPKFTKLSNHLKGIKNYRVEIFEANPMTFLQPTHSDDDGFFFVANGKGTITLVTSDNRESFNIQQGHIMKIPAGTTVYLINRDNEEKLVIVKLIQPINNAGESVAFFGAGGRNPESFLNAFSPEVVEALFKVPRDKSESLFGKQGQGIVTRASKEQIRALSKEEGDEGYWPFGGGKSRTSNGPFDIFKKRPLQKNEFGRLIEVDSEDLRQLSDLNMKVSFANITQGGMHTLYYNTRATKIAVVTNGKGNFQMACPHISAEGKQNKHQKEEKSIVHYQTVNGVLRSGTVFVVPAGHPFVTVASKKDNLEVICFEVNAEDNERIPLAGRKSLFKQFEREAKELAFEVKAEVLDEFLEKQEEEFFFEGPRRRKERETGRSDE